MTPAGRWLVATATLSVMLLAAGGVQAGCGLYLLLKTSHDVTSSANVIAGLWALLTGTLSAVLCGTGPRCLWHRSQLQVALLCTATAASAASAVVSAMVPATSVGSAVNPAAVSADDISLLHTVNWLAIGSVWTAGLSGFVAANLAVAMQLLVPGYGPILPSSSSPKSGSSDAYSVRFATMEMKQKSSDLKHLSPPAAWVYRSQSSTSTTTQETKLDPPLQPTLSQLELFTTAHIEESSEEHSSCSSGSFKVHAMTTTVQRYPTTEPTPSVKDNCPTEGQFTRCVSLLGSVYPERSRQHAWPPLERQTRSASLMEVPGPRVTAAAVARVTSRPASTDCLQTHRAEMVAEVTASHSAIDEEQEEAITPHRVLTFPPRPVALDSSPVHTPLPQEQAASAGSQRPLTDTIGRLTTALTRLRSEPDYCASKDLEEALQALQQLSPELECFSSTRHPPSHEPVRPDSSTSNASSSGYGSPEDAGKECRHQEEHHVVDVIRVERSVAKSSTKTINHADEALVYDTGRSVGEEWEGQASMVIREEGDYQQVCEDNRTHSETDTSTEIYRNLPVHGDRCVATRDVAGRRSEDGYHRQSVVQLVSILESTRGASARWRRPSEPPPPVPSVPQPPPFVPPPPPPSTRQMAMSEHASHKNCQQRQSVPTEACIKQTRARVLLESEC